MNIVKSQTGILDNKTIREAIDHHHGNVIDAICALVHGSNVRPAPPPLPFDEKDALAQLRDILNEKDAIYHDMMQRARPGPPTTTPNT